MKIATRVFISSMLFGAIVGLIYWFTTKDVTGTFLLGLFATGFLIVSAYLYLLRHETSVDGDESQAPSELAGEQIAIISSESPWPPLLALSTWAFAVGVALLPVLGGIGALCFLFVTYQLVREST